MSESLRSNLSFIDLPMEISLLSMAGDAAEDADQDKCSIPDALVRCIRDTGRVDIDRIARYSDAAAGEVIEALRGQFIATLISGMVRQIRAGRLQMNICQATSG